MNDFQNSNSIVLTAVPPETNRGRPQEYKNSKAQKPKNKIKNPIRKEYHRPNHVWTPVMIELFKTAFNYLINLNKEWPTDLLILTKMIELDTSPNCANTKELTRKQVASYHQRFKKLPASDRLPSNLPQENYQNQYNGTFSNIQYVYQETTGSEQSSPEVSPTHNAVTVIDTDNGVMRTVYHTDEEVSYQPPQDMYQCFPESQDLPQDTGFVTTDFFNPIQQPQVLVPTSDDPFYNQDNAFYDPLNLDISLKELNNEFKEILNDQKKENRKIYYEKRKAQKFQLVLSSDSETQSDSEEDEK